MYTVIEKNRYQENNKRKLVWLYYYQSRQDKGIIRDRNGTT